VNARLAALTPEQRAELVRRLQKQRSARAENVAPQKAGEARVLSFAQQQLWFLEQLTPGGTPYNVPIYLRLRGGLDVEALRRALNAIAGRHEVLRTRITTVDGRPAPAVAAEWAVPLRQFDLRTLPAQEREPQAQRILRAEAARAFDFSRDLMLRGLLIRLVDDVCIFLHNSHHIAWDLGSKAIFYRELETFYKAYVLGKTPVAPELPVQYSDFAAWQREWLKGETLERLESYWREQLSGAAVTLDLPADRPRPRVQTLRGAKRNASLTKAVLEQGRTLSAQSNVTLFMTMLAAFGVFLYSLTGQEDILIGSPFDGRDREETKDLIGFFINTVAFRIRPAPQLTFRELMRRVREVTLGALEHAQLPFHKVVEIVRPPRDLSRSPLFQVNFRLQPGPPVPLRLDGLEVEGPYVVDNAAAKFDLALELPSVESAAGFWEYSTDLFDRSRIDQMAAEFDRLFAALVTQPDIPLEQLEFIRSSRKPDTVAQSSSKERNVSLDANQWTNEQR